MQHPIPSLEWMVEQERDLAAVTQSGYALKWASEELREDREVVLAAVT